MVLKRSYPFLLLAKYYSGNQREELIRKGMWHIREGGEMYTEFCWGNLREGDSLEDSGVNGNITFNIRQEIVARAWWTGLIWLRI